MFRLRSVNLQDVDDLLLLSKLSRLINLPNDRDIIQQKVLKSEKSFSNPSTKLEENLYIFVLEDISKGKVVGVSMIHGLHGTKDHPHMCFRIGKERKYSKTLDMEVVHKTLQFVLCDNGWSEIGGLVLDPAYRGNNKKLGKQLSFVRFLYIALNPDQFTDHIHVEIVPPLELSSPPLWEEIGKKFVDMEYSDADELSRDNKEFVLSLYPSGPIYQSLLSYRVRQSIGKVSRHARPVVKMLEGIGFKRTNEIDPFDGGPHYRCKTSDIVPVKNLLQVSCKGKEKGDTRQVEDLLIKLNPEEGGFQSVHIRAVLDRGSNEIFIDKKSLEILRLKIDDKIYAVNI